MNINFKYIEYNIDSNKLYENINNYTSKENLIITEDGMAKKFFLSDINYKKLRTFENILSLDEFIEKIFLPKKNVLKDIKRFLAFYSCLDKKMKENFNIKSYYDCIEIADDFFEFFKYIKNKKSLEKLKLSKWQSEKIEAFYKIKNIFDKFLEENNYIPSDWIYEKENLDLFYLKKFKKIVFYDIVSFPLNFSEILKEIAEEKEIEIVLQLKSGDFDEKKLRIKNITLPDTSINLSLREYKNEFELYNLIQEKKQNNLEIYSTNLNIEDRYSIFENSNKYIFNDTKFYKILETYINILENRDINNQDIDLFYLREYIFTSSFMDFYGFDKEDYKTFENILAADYRYISYNLLEEGYFNFYFENNKNLYDKLKLILRNIEKVEKIKNIEDLNIYLREVFFSSVEDVDYFLENKYTSLYDKLYEILGILNSNQNMDYFQYFSKFFDNNIGKNIFILFFNYLNKITLYTEEKYENNEQHINLKDLYSAKFLNKIGKDFLLIHVDSQVLPKLKKSNNLFTEKQKAILNIMTFEEENVIEKYRTFQNLLNFPTLEIASLVDLDSNIDFSPFIYEYKNKYKSSKSSQIKSFKVNLLEEKNIENNRDKIVFREYRKEKEDFKNGILKIGAYDYTSLVDGETFFFLDKLCKLDSQDEIEEINGISAKLLGIILHKTMEDIFKKNWKNILKAPENILLKEDEIKDFLDMRFKKENLKIENFMKNYLNEVLILRLVKNIKKFLIFLYEELKDTKILRIEAEKIDRREIAFCEANNIQVYLSGRADLLIESEKANYIIDFKTGSVDKRQLDFYAVMFYGNLNSIPCIYSFAYNFWKENEAETINLEENKVKDLLLLKNEMEEKIKNFLENPVYKLPSKSKLKEYKYDFKKSYNYKYLCPLEKIEGDK
ncbi:MAG: PD-(D/E)XK nuclease family protein [Fusobacterium sp.]|nr:PD-(D/E)XK nuclease family protein [Fusobacterium sp.]